MLQELRADADAESFQHQEQFRFHAELANNPSLERQEQFKANAKFVRETLNAKILECQMLKELKANTKLNWWYSGFAGILFGKWSHQVSSQ